MFRLLLWEVTLAVRVILVFLLGWRLSLIKVFPTHECNKMTRKKWVVLVVVVAVAVLSVL